MRSYRLSAMAPPAIFLAAVLGVLPACGTGRPAGRAAPTPVADARRPPADRAGHAVPAPTTIPPPQRLFPLVVGRRTYRVESNQSDQAAVGVIHLRRIRGDTAFAWRRKTVDGRTEHLGLAADGTVLVQAVEEPAWDSRTVYDPPLPSILAGLVPGQPVVREANMTVYSRKNPKKIKNRGTCRVTITATAPEALRIGSRTYAATRIRTKYQGNLRLASVKSEHSSWYVPDIGLVKEESEENVRALVVGWTVRRRLELVESAGPKGGKERTAKQRD